MIPFLVACGAFVCVMLGALAGMLPAVLAYRTEVAENLAPLS